MKHVVKYSGWWIFAQYAFGQHTPWFWFHNDVEIFEHLRIYNRQNKQYLNGIRFRNTKSDSKSEVSSLKKKHFSLQSWFDALWLCPAVTFTLSSNWSYTPFLRETYWKSWFMIMFPEEMRGVKDLHFITQFCGNMIFWLGWECQLVVDSENLRMFSELRTSLVTVCATLKNVSYVLKEQIF